MFSAKLQVEVVVLHWLKIDHVNMALFLRRFNCLFECYRKKIYIDFWWESLWQIFFLGNQTIELFFLNIFVIPRYDIIFFNFLVGWVSRHERRKFPISTRVFVHRRVRGNDRSSRNLATRQLFVFTSSGRNVRREDHSPYQWNGVERQQRIVLVCDRYVLAWIRCFCYEEGIWYLSIKHTKQTLEYPKFSGLFCT